ncbi:uncharacterized protein BDV17DRAFT_288728 [Aspergillus undulatus]|uniref:uncharacterized protein n=1 Tax=Aspergillus undulatus TaxID=1810928 RepID=UPI003CCD0FE9
METNVDEASAAIAQLSSIDVSDDSSHREIIQKCQSIISTLQDPGQVVMETLASVAKYPCLVALSNLGIFSVLASTTEPLSATHLAEKCSADKWHIVRLMRVDATWDIISKIGPVVYAATGASRVFASPAFAAGLRNTLFSSQIISNLPAYLTETSYTNPSEHEKSLFQYHFKTDLGLFEWRAGNKAAMDDFNLFMTIQRTRGQQVETFRIKDRIFDGATVDDTKPLLVDIAGGFGQDLRLVKGVLTSGSESGLYVLGKGQLVLEDQAQPVWGPAAALTPGYSRLRILDGIVPDTGADKIMAALDIGGWVRIERVTTGEDGFGLIEAVFVV